MRVGAQSAPQDQFLTLLVIGVLFLLFVSIYRRREGIRHFLRRTIIGEGAYLLLAFYLTKRGVQPIPALGMAVLAGLAVERLLIKPRSRHIRASERRKAIADYERTTGRKHNRKTDELDHEIAFARGGSSTADNLRVRSRTENRRKGKKSPWWDLLGR